MIRHKRKLGRFYKQLIKKEKFSYRQALAIYENLHREAVFLDVIHLKNMLEE